MTKKTIGILSIVGVLALGVILLLGSVIPMLNREAALRTTIEAKQRDNTSQFDNMFKVIQQTAGVAVEHKNSLKEIFNEYAAARAGGPAAGGGSLATWIKEAVPNADLQTFNNVQNIIVSHRGVWTMKQTELLDLNREHTEMFRRIPSSFILPIFGRETLNVTIITSTRTEEAFKTGKDDDVDLFPKPTPLER